VLLHARRQAHRVALRRVVHAQIVADLAHDDLSGIEAHANRKIQSARQPQLIGVGPERVAQVQRGVAGALRVVLVGDGRAEQRHDAVAGVLVHRAFEAVHAVGEDLEEAIENLMPLFRIDLLGQFHRAFDVGEQHGDLLALAFEGGLRLQDFVGEVLGRVGTGGLPGLGCQVLGVRCWVSGVGCRGLTPETWHPAPAAGRRRHHRSVAWEDSWCRSSGR